MMLVLLIGVVFISLQHTAANVMTVDPTNESLTTVLTADNSTMEANTSVGSNYTTMESNYTTMESNSTLFTINNTSVESTTIVFNTNTTTVNTTTGVFTSSDNGTVVDWRGFTVEPTDVDDGWVQFDDVEYKVFDPPSTYDDAKYLCSQHSAKLPEPKGELQNQRLETLDIGTEFFLGMSDERNEGTWTWASDGGTVRWFNWITTRSVQEPDGGDRDNCAILCRDNCAILYRDSEHEHRPGGWADATCQMAHTVVCERRVVAAPKHRVQQRSAALSHPALAGLLAVTSLVCVVTSLYDL